jgi:AraC-like DNA-binding protein
LAAGLREEHSLGVTKSAILETIRGGVAAGAKADGVSRRTFQRRFTNGAGTLRELLRLLRIGAAKEMIAAGVSSRIAARRLGFTNVSSFRSFVRRETSTGIRNLRTQTRGKSETR